MSGIQHVFRRLSVYWWRRRLRIGTASCAYLRIEVSLCTKDKAVARSIAPYLTLRSAELVHQIRDGLMTPEEAKKVFIHLVQQETARIDHLELNAPQRLDTPDKRRRSDLAMAASLRLIAAQGWDAIVGPTQVQQLLAEGFDEVDIEEVRQNLELHQDLELGKVHEPRARQILFEAGVSDSAVSRSRVQAIYLRALAAVFQNKSNRWMDLAKSDEDLLREALSSSPMKSLKTRTATPEHLPIPPEPVPPATHILREPSFSPKRIAPRHDSDDDVDAHEPEAPANVVQPASIPSERPVGRRSGNLVEIVIREAGVKQANGEWGDTQVRQHAALARLLVKFLGHSDPTLITQVDIADFRAAVIQFPKNHGKSPEDHAMTFDQILEKAKKLPAEKVGLSGTTMNRYLTQINSIATICKHSGYPFAEYQGVEGFRFSKKGNKRNERPGFTTEEIEILVDLPVWRGCASEELRFEAGALVFHDAKYWAPLLAMYTAARREEYCGLFLEEIDYIDELPVIRIENNAIRKLKTEQSERNVAIHPELMRLGFLDYVQALRDAGHTMLFPELKPASTKTPMGDVFDDSWQAMRAAALPRAKEEGKTLHSFRHWFNNELKQQEVAAEIRRDILGHLNEDVNEGRYTEAASPQLMLQAMAKLPVPTAKLHRFPIRLITHVIEHRQRKSRKRARPAQMLA